MDWKSLLANVAPVIAGIVTGPFAPLAVGATAALSSLLLGKTDATTDELTVAVQNATPEQLFAIKQLDMQWEKNRQDFLTAQGLQAIQSDTLDVDNTKDARARDVAIVQKSGENIRADLAVVFVCVGLIACIGVLVFFPDKISGEVIGVVTTIASIFGLCLRDYFNFEFGSSRASRNKDDVIATMASTANGTPTNTPPTQ